MSRKPAVTIKDIAKELGLSPKAVSTGLNGTGRLAPETRLKIKETAHRMGYVRNAAARSLVMRRSYLLGVLVPYINNSFFSRIIAGMEYVAAEHDFSLLLGDTRGELNSQRRQVERLLQRNVDGLILYPTSTSLALAPEIEATGVPLIQIMNHYPALGAGAVTVDNFHGGSEAARRLLAAGHRNIGLIVHDEVSPELRRRRLGFESVIAGSGAKLVTIAAPMSQEGGAVAATELLRHPELSAIFAASDFAALGFLRTALALGRRIPEELSVIGFDDLEIAAQQVLYPLTTIAQPKEELGRKAVLKLLELLEGKTPEVEVMRPQLVLRATFLG